MTRRTPMPRTWPQTLIKWTIPFIPPPLRGLTLNSGIIAFKSIGTLFKAIIISIIYDLPLRMQCLASLWFLGWYIFIQYLEIGAIYILISTFVGMMVHLGEKKEGELSAYSVFNSNFQRLIGTTTAEDLIRQQFGGMMNMLPGLRQGANMNMGMERQLDNEGNENENDRNREDGIEEIDAVGRRRNRRVQQERNEVVDEEWNEQINGGNGGARRRRRK